MAGDLERFLQQAAERLAEKLNQGQAGQPRPQPRPAASVRRAERTRIDPDILDAEIVDAELVQPANTRELGPNPLSNIDTRRKLAQEIDQADERMAHRIHEDLDHDLVQLKDASKALERHDGDSSSGEVSYVERRVNSVSPLVDMLRQPETLRAAFIASEIFRRKF